MKTLLVMRHAKSDWSTGLRDFDRPLNDRGSNDASRMGSFLHSNKLIPDCILSSASMRTRQTTDNLRASFHIDDTDVHFTDDLYLADLSTLLTAIDNWLPSAERLLLLAHNPGIDDLVMHLSHNQCSLTPDGKLMTTASLAQFETEDNGPLTSANLIQLIRPREL